MEGRKVNFTGSGSAVPATATTATSVAVLGVPPYVGHVMWIDNICVNVSQPLVGLFGFSGNSAIAGGIAFPQYQKQFVVATPGGGERCFPINGAFRAFESAGGGWQVTSTNLLSSAPGTDRVYGSAIVNGTVITDDFNFSAAKTIEVIGDSIGDCTGATLTTNCWAFQFRDYLRTKGNDVRLVLKTIGGSTTGDHEILGKAGFHDLMQVNLGLYELGMNDSIQSIPTATSLANMQSAWARFHAKNPKTPLVIMGVGPAENALTDTNATALRAAASAWVASAGQPLLKYCNIGTAFDRTQVSTYFYASDTTGSHIHPNDTGHAAYATALEACVASQNITVS